MTKKNSYVPVNTGKVKYRYIPHRVYGITNPKHVLFDGKLDSSIDKFCVLRNETGRWVIDLNESERKYLTEELNLGPTDLDLNNPNNPYLKSIEIEMPKAGITLNTTDARDYLYDKVLLAYDNVIASSSKEKDNKQTYVYVRLKENEETEAYLEVADLKKEVYKLLGVLENSRERMIMFILSRRVRLNPKVPTSELRKMVNKEAEHKPKEFKETLKDPLFVEKGLLNMGVIVKVIDLRSGLYYFDERPLAFEGQVANLINAAQYLADKTNSDINLAISEKVLNEFNGTK